MTVQTNTNSIAYVGNGSTVHFDYDFLILDSAHLKVYFDSVLQTSGYVVSGVGSQSGGTVAFSAAPANGVGIDLVRDVPFYQLTDYQPYDAFPADTHERALDLLTMMAQQLKDGLSRTMQHPVGGNKWDAEGNEIINVADGGSDTSVPSVGQVRKIIANTVGDDPSAAASIRSLEALRRSYRSYGYNIVEGGFKAGFTLSSPFDVAIDEPTGKGYTGPAGTYPENTDPNGIGFVDRSVVKYYNGVSELKAATDIIDGDDVCSGMINWDVKNFGTLGKCLPLQNGLFAYPKNAINILDFGADDTGVLLVNTALNDAADVGPVYCPPGIYRIENFIRRVQPGNSNIGQEKLVVYGDLSPYTLQHQYMVTPAVFEGDGDLFKSVVNYAFANIGVRNRSSLPTTYPDVPGTLFSMYGKGLEAGVFIGCYFGAAMRHFSQEATGGIPTTEDDYMIGPNYDACSFFHALEYSRYFDGVVANYSETGKCYTSHSARGLYMKSPGPGVGVIQSIYEYIDDEAIIVDAYGFVANYSVTMDRVFFESCGGNLATIAGQTKPEKSKAIPSIKIATIAANGAKVLFKHNNCFATYTGANPPVAHFSIPAGNGTTTIQMVESGFLNGVAGTETYTADTTTYVDPFSIANTLHKIKDGVEAVKHLVVGEGQREPSAPVDVKSQTNTVMWSESLTTSIRQVMLAQGIAADFGVGPTGFFLSQLAGSIDFRLNAGDAYIDKAGKGLVLRSPNGAITKRLTIDNTGALVVS